MTVYTHDMGREQLVKASLADVMRWYSQGWVGRADAQWYLDRWNEGAFRFTFAYLDGPHHIRQRERTTADDLFWDWSRQYV